MKFSKNVFRNGKTSKDVCEEAKKLVANPVEGMSQTGLDKFEALVCGREGIPDPSEGSSDGSNDEYSLESMCYFYNYEHFAHHVAGPDDGDVPTIMPAGFQFDDTFGPHDKDPHCVMIVEGEEVDRVRDCDCSNPREFMKNMLNKGMCFYIFEMS